MFHSIKQLEERNVPNEINFMVWSHRMDIVAVANIKGEVTLHRLTWKIIWILNPPKHGLLVNHMAWRPDGNVLAISYDNNTIIIVNVETKATITDFKVHAGKVTYLGWAQVEKEQEESDCDTMNPNRDVSYKSINEDLSKIYLEDPPLLCQTERSVNNLAETKGLLPSLLRKQTEFNMLVLGTKDGTLEIRILGCAVKCLSLNVANYMQLNRCSIENVHFSKDLSKMFVSICDENIKNITTILFNSSIFHTHCQELYQFTMKCVKLHELLTYFNTTILNITETWENILIEMDDKLSKYASQVPEGGVTADFLELLIFGHYTKEMESFLTHDLTRRGLEKFGQTMDNSYSNIQSYLFQHIIKYVQNGTYYLAELKGMAYFIERYKIIGLNLENIQKAIRSNGEFAMKAAEMQQIIDHSLANFKAFFRWLYLSILHLHDEVPTEEIQKVTQQDVVSIAEFVQNFDKYGTSNDDISCEDKEANKIESDSAMFKMERIGQYLIDSELQIKPDMSGNEWNQFLEENPCLKNDKSVLQPDPNKSLVQAYNALKQDVEEIFQTPAITLQEILPTSKIWNFNLYTNNCIRMSSINTANSNMSLFAFIQSPTSICLVQVRYADDSSSSSNRQVRCGIIFFPCGSEGSDELCYNIIDINFYSNSILSVLLQQPEHGSKGVITQFHLLTSLMENLTDFNESNIPKINGFQIDHGSIATLKNTEIPVCRFAVSGSRNVMIVLAENKKKIKLYEMECECEDVDEYDLDSSNNKYVAEDINMEGSFSIND